MAVDRRLAVLAAGLKKTLGNGSVGNSVNSVSKTHRIRTGSLALDMATGGGIPIGRIVEFFGEKSSGKTSNTARIIANAQRLCRNCYRPARDVTPVPPETPDDRGTLTGSCTCYAEGLWKPFLPFKKESGETAEKFRERVAATEEAWKLNSYDEFVCTLIDIEGTWDKGWAKNLGVFGEQLFYVRPETAEEGIDAMHALIRSGEIDLCALDSIAQMVPSKETEESVTGDAWVNAMDPSGAVRVMRMRELVAEWSDAGTWMVRALNQTTGMFEWAAIRRVWRHAEGKRLFRFETKYGRQITVTEDHALYRLLPTNERRDQRRHMMICDGQRELVRGGEIRVGDTLLMEADVALPGGEDRVRVWERMPVAASPKDRLYLAHESMAAFAYKLPETKNNGWSLKNGVHGPCLPLDVVRERGIEVPVDGWLYTTGASAMCAAVIPAEKIAYLLGQFLGDGFLTGVGSKRTMIRLCAGIEAHAVPLLERLRSDLGEYVSPGPRLRETSKRNQHIEIGCRPLAELFARWCGGQKALTKRVPSEAFGWSDTARRALIDGLIDSDGHVTKAGRAFFKTISEGLATDLVLLLKSVGVVAGIRRFKVGVPTTVRGADGVERLLTPRHPSMDVTFSWRAFSGENDGNSGRRKLSMLVPDGVPVRVRSVEEVPTEETFDLEVAEGFSTFVANDILVHNSSEKWQQGLQARLINKMARTLTASGTAVRKDSGRLVTQIWLNQTRCVDANSWVFTERGMVRAGEAAGQAMTLVGRSGQPELIEAYDRSMQTRVQIDLKRGHRLVTGERHPLLVLHMGRLKWVPANELEPFHWVALSRAPKLAEVPVELPRAVPSGTRSKPVKTPRYMSEEFAEFLGMWFSDGSLVWSKKAGLMSFTENDKDRRRLVTERLVSLFGRCYTSGPQIALHSSSMYQWFLSLGMQAGAANKTIPSVIRTRSAWRGFLRGMFDSHVVDHGFRMSVSNEGAARQIQAVLLAFGVSANLQKHVGWELQILGEDAAVYLREIGFVEPKKAAALSKMKPDPSARGRADVVPGLWGTVMAVVRELKAKKKWSKRADPLFWARMVAYERAKNGLCLAWRDLEEVVRRADVERCHLAEMDLLRQVLKERHIWLPVEKLTKLEPSECVDFDMPTSRTFVANGFVTHNTKIGVMFGDPTTKPGGNGQDFATTIEIKMWGGKTDVEEVSYGTKEETITKVVAEDLNWKITKNKSAATKGSTGYHKQCLIAHDGYRKGQVIEDEFVFKLAMHRNLIQKTGTKYKLLDREFTSQVGIQTALREDAMLFEAVREALLQIALKELDA